MTTILIGPIFRSVSKAYSLQGGPKTDTRFYFLG